MTENRERRKYTRFRVTEGAFAFINKIPFTIGNISENGVQLQSVVFDGSPNEEMLLDFFLQNDNFYLQDLPVRLVRFQRKYSCSPFSNTEIKFFGLQFGELTQQQKTRLDYFIAHSTIGEA